MAPRCVSIDAMCTTRGRGNASVTYVRGANTGFGSGTTTRWLVLVGAEHRRLTQILAATWLIGHSDLHRRNLVFLHAEVGPTASITIASLHDISSAQGLKNIDQTLAIGIARQQRLTRIRPRVWIAHANECGLDPEETIEIVRATARRIRTNGTLRSAPSQRPHFSTSRSPHGAIGWSLCPGPCTTSRR